MEQIKQKRAQQTLEKNNKFQQERMEVERDNEMRKQHAIMQAQRRQLQAGNVAQHNVKQNMALKAEQAAMIKIEREQA